MAERPIVGRCFCGHIRFELTGEPLFACHCHCRSCQHSAGAAFVTWATFPSESFDVTEGAVAEYRSSEGVRRGHCTNCGTTLTYEHSNRAGEIDVALASLDDPTVATPQAHIWIQDKAAWYEIEDDLPQYRTTVTAGDPT